MGALEDLFDVRGQVALVTGGASGLGYAFASVLADAGAAGGEPPAGGSSGPPLVSGRALDVSDAADVRALVDDIVDAQGRIDIVFANAGVARGRPPMLPEGWLDDMSMPDYDTLIDINLHGVVYTVQ